MCVCVCVCPGGGGCHGHRCFRGQTDQGSSMRGPEQVSEVGMQQLLCGQAWLCPSSCLLLTQAAERRTQVMMRPAFAFACSTNYLVLCQCVAPSRLLLQQRPHFVCQQVKASLADTRNTRPQHPAQVCHGGVVAAHPILTSKGLQQPRPLASHLQPALATTLGFKSG